ncbi:MAG: DMT family transporter [Candidatus Micrarchaeota archaeon]
MFWFFLALGGAFLDSIYYFLIKKSSSSNLRFFVLGLFYLFSAIIFVYLYFTSSSIEINKNFYIAFGIAVVLNILITLLYAQALKSEEMSLVMPVLSFTPVFLIITSYFILGESISILGFLGISLVCVGSYVLNFSSTDKSILQTIKRMLSNKAIFYMFLMAILASFSWNFIKLSINNSSVIFHNLFMNLSLGITFLILYLKEKKSLEKVDYRYLLSISIVLALVNAISSLLTTTAITLVAVSYVVSINRLSIIFAVLLGMLFLKESNSLQRLLGALIMVAGAAIILVFS